jgi:hypothetical protein
MRKELGVVVENQSTKKTTNNLGVVVEISINKENKKRVGSVSRKTDQQRKHQKSWEW